MISRRLLLAVPALAISGPAFAQTAPAAPMPVAATFSILADLVRNVGGERVSVASLVGPDGDAHVYSPTPQDARMLVGARLVFVNGLGFEGWINRLIRSSGTRATVVTASRGVRALPAEKAAGHSHGHSHAHGEFDPHVWQNPALMKTYVGNIRDALIAADAAGREVYERNAAAYSAALDALDAEVKAAIATTPADRRRILTAHDAFRYFEAAYGVTFIAPRGVSTEAEPSAQDVARLIRQIRERRISAVFLENVTDPRLAQRIATETGARIGGTLFSDALSRADGPAPTYLDLIRHNMRQIVSALTPTG